VVRHGCPRGLRHLFIVQETHSLRRYRCAPVTALEAAALLPMLLPSWMDPDELIKSFGA
jgi:hypothetical protein